MRPSSLAESESVSSLDMRAWDGGEVMLVIGGAAGAGTGSRILLLHCDLQVSPTHTRCLGWDDTDMFGDGIWDANINTQ